MPTRPLLPVGEPSILTRAAKVIERSPRIRPIEDPHPPLLDLPIKGARWLTTRTRNRR
jgi:hypothetical protein